MPLLDHFHAPLADERHWESFHSVWAGEIMATLNQEVLPPGYFAEAQVHINSRVEVDVGSFAEPHQEQGEGGVAMRTWSPTVAGTRIPAVFPDEFEVRVFHNSGGPDLVGALELVSPRNKDRTEARRAFAAKCLAYLQVGVGLIVVDVVTDRRANLHDEVVSLLGRGPEAQFPASTPLYATAYRPFRSEGESDQIEFWPFPLRVGGELPEVPLPLRGGPTLPLDLEATYTRTRARCRLD